MMLATPTNSVTSAERIYENDVVYKFIAKSNGLTISIGKVYIDRRDPARTSRIVWYVGEKTRETVDEALERARIFLLNREVYIGSVAVVRQVKKAGFIVGTRHTLVGQVEKVEPDGTRRKYIVPGIPLQRLENVYPFKIGHHVYSKGWIGKVTNVFIRTRWTFDRATNIATGTLPITLVGEFQLKQGMTMDKLPEKIYKECNFKSSSWNPLTKRNLHKKPATLTEISTVRLEICWIGPSDAVGSSTTKPAGVIPADTKSVKVFHFCNNDWESFAPGESFKMSWTAEDQDNALGYEKWQSYMLVSSTGLQFGEDPPLKRVKGDPIFKIGERVVVTPITLMTQAAVTFPNGPTAINHTMMAFDIPELGPEVRPREVPLDVPFQIKNMDLVRHRKKVETNGGVIYGFVLDPVEGTDGKILVKWIHDWGGSDTLEKTDLVSTGELMHLAFQSEFNPKMQEKVVETRDGNLGTLKGIIFPSCKAVVRVVGTFEDKEYWPHDLAFMQG